MHNLGNAWSRKVSGPISWIGVYIGRTRYPLSYCLQGPPLRIVQCFHVQQRDIPAWGQLPSLACLRDIRSLGSLERSYSFGGGRHRRHCREYPIRAYHRPRSSDGSAMAAGDGYLSRFGCPCSKYQVLAMRFVPVQVHTSHTWLRRAGGSVTVSIGAQVRARCCISGSRKLVGKIRPVRRLHHLQCQGQDGENRGGWVGDTCEAGLAKHDYVSAGYVWVCVEGRRMDRRGGAWPGRVVACLATCST